MYEVDGGRLLTGIVKSYIVYAPSLCKACQLVLECYVADL